MIFKVNKSKTQVKSFPNFTRHHLITHNFVKVNMAARATFVRENSNQTSSSQTRNQFKNYYRLQTPIPCPHRLMIMISTKGKRKQIFVALDYFLFSWCTVCGPVSGHKRRKHVFRTRESLQSAVSNTKSSFSIQKTDVKLTAV